MEKILLVLVSVIIFFSVSNAESEMSKIPVGSVRVKDMLIYVVSPVTSNKILPQDSLIPGTISDTISIVACKGEYEPASFVVSAISDINSLGVKATSLKGKQGSIASSNIDIRVVKCWYQAGTAWVSGVPDKSRRVLVPELLLKDDSLVKVDYEKEENYLKVIYPEGEKYVCISKEKDPFHKYGKDYSMIPIDALPVRDARNLLPVNIPAKTNKQFWITIKVPDNANPGIYTGKINLIADKNKLSSTSLTLRLKVLPFKLLKPYYTSSIYYTGRPDLSNKGSISCVRKTREQFKKELENMFAHGVTNPIIYIGPSLDLRKELLSEILRVRQEVGMGNQPFLYGGIRTGNPTTSEALESLKKRIREVIEFTRNYGIPEVYFYGIDEARGEKLKSQRPAWKAVHEAGGKVFVAGYKGSNFEIMGDLQDLFVCARMPSREEAKKWHSVGSKIFCYGNPQAGVENPEVYRRNYGLLLWQNDYDGAATWTYHFSWGNVWNDFDSSRYRDENFTYPTADGVIDTIAWEGYREGVDDIRYLTTLVKSIDKAKKSGNKKVRKVASLAKKYLRKLKETGLKERNLDTIRLEMIDYILKLTEEVF